MLAGTGCGDFSTAAECSAEFYRTARCFDPDPRRRARYEEIYPRFLENCRRIYGP